MNIFIYTIIGIIGILFGYKTNNHKVLNSVLIGVSLYYIMQVIILGIIYIIGYFNTDIGVLFKEATSTIMNSSFESLIISVNILYLIFIIIMYFVGKKVFNKGVNVD